MSNIFFLSMCDVKLFLTFASLGLVLLWQLFYLFCSSIVINACTNSGSLRFLQFSGCWLILSVYILMSFDSFCKIVRSSVILLLPLFKLKTRSVIIVIKQRSCKCGLKLWSVIQIVVSAEQNKNFKPDRR